MNTPTTDAAMSAEQILERHWNELEANRPGDIMPWCAIEKDQQVLAMFLAAMQEYANQPVPGDYYQTVPVKEAPLNQLVTCGVVGDWRQFEFITEAHKRNLVEDYELQLWLKPVGAVPMQSLQDELADLRRWKAEALAVMPDFQEIGKELNLPLGSSVSAQILPAIKARNHDNRI